MRRDTVGTLEDILTAARRILDRTHGQTLDSFRQDVDLRQIVERNFEIIGEATNRLRRHDPAVLERISGYQKIIAFRNILIHAYDRIDAATVWHAIQESLPVLLAEVTQPLREANERELKGPSDW
jgi:uncharacterized protein with HEPN domain